MAFSSGILGASQVYPYRIQFFADSRPNISQGLSFDSEDNLYIVGESQQTINSGGSISFKDAAYISKSNNLGVVQWEKILSGTPEETFFDEAFFESVTDSAGNTYVTGRVQQPSIGRILTAKYDTNGNLQWQRFLGSLFTNRGVGIALDSLNNVYVLGTSEEVEDNFEDDPIIVKYDSNGVLQWQKGIITPTALDEFAWSIEIDQSDNIYVSSRFRYPDTTTSSLILKLNTAGSIQWSKTLDLDARKLKSDSLGNLYIASTDTSGSVYGLFDAVLTKLDSSGDILWQRVAGNDDLDSTNTIDVDSSNNVYFTLTQRNDSSGTNVESTFILFYDSLGNLQWKNGIFNEDDENYSPVRNGKVDSQGNFYITSPTNIFDATSGILNGGILLIVLPKTGALTQVDPSVNSTSSFVRVPGLENAIRFGNDQFTLANFERIQESAASFPTSDVTEGTDFTLINTSLPESAGTLTEGNTSLPLYEVRL